VQVVDVAGKETEKKFVDLLPSTKYIVQVEGHVTEDGHVIDSPKGAANASTSKLLASGIFLILNNLFG